MRIVQSFWSCNKNLIENSFGWLSPQYHLMAWALSSLRLSEYYNDLHLYTDTNGSDIFIKYLCLPYKTVHVNYDSINHYHENLWALPKIMTYAAQSTPFIHVDGDVFIWNRFSQNLENANLIAQNQEIGTEYYRTLMNIEKKNLSYTPDIITKILNQEPMISHNAGIIGGKDIDFFKKYTDKALSIVNNNANNLMSVNFNILYEQLLFSALSIEEKKHVSCLYSDVFNDNGYTSNKFCDFSSVTYCSNYLHLIGAKKRDKNICDLMGRVLFKEYPEYFHKIISLFKTEHEFFKRESKKNSLEHENLLDYIKTKDFTYRRTKQIILKIENNQNERTLKQVELYVQHSASLDIKEVFNYERKLVMLLYSWRKISLDYLLELEKRTTHYFDFFHYQKDTQLDIILEHHPYLNITEESFEWTQEVKKFIHPDLVIKGKNEPFGIACIPQVFFRGYNEIAIDELDYNILSLLEKPISLKYLLENLKDCFVIDDCEDSEGILFDLVLIKLKALFFNKLVFFKKDF